MSDVDFAAYNSGNVMILEYPKPYFWMLVVLLFLSFVGIPLALYTTSIYETEGKKDGIDWHNRGVSYSTFTILGILSLLIVVFLGYSIYNRAKRNIVDSNDKLQEQAAKIYAHAYGEKAKELAIGAGGNKLQGFKDQMYTHLQRAFADESVADTVSKLVAAPNTIDGGKDAANGAAGNIGEGIGNSAAEAAAEAAAAARQRDAAAAAAEARQGREAAAAAEARQGREAAAAAEARQREEAAAAEARQREEAAAAAEAPTEVRVPQNPGEIFDIYGKGAAGSPISLSRSYRRRKSPSSLKKKKKKASPSSKKKKASPTKKKSTSSRRK
jgi:uncharacterized protein YneF (UPF0154 family)